MPESPLTISYELKNVSANPVVTASSDGNFIVSIKRTTSTAGTITIKANDESRDGYVNIIATDDSGRSVVSIINLDVQKRLILKVSVTSSNSYRVGLPLHGEIDCQIDWGDGIVEHLAGTYNGKEWPAAHQYGSKELEYIVKIGGKVTWLCSRYPETGPAVPYQSVTEVIQWGDTELTKMDGAFASNQLLRLIPADETGVFSNVTSFAEAFYNCKGLRAIPEGLFANCSKVTNFTYAFADCSGLTRMPEGLFANCPNVADFSNTFLGCSGLTSIPSSLFANCRKVTDFSFTFAYCTSLTCESPYSIINGVKVHLYERSNYPDCFVAPTNHSVCFYNCSKLTDYSKIPSGWK